MMAATRIENHDIETVEKWLRIHRDKGEVGLSANRRDRAFEAISAELQPLIAEARRDILGFDIGLGLRRISSAKVKEWHLKVAEEVEKGNKATADWFRNESDLFIEQQSRNGKVTVNQMKLHAQLLVDAYVSYSMTRKNPIEAALVELENMDAGTLSARIGELESRTQELAGK